MRMVNIVPVCVAALAIACSENAESPSGQRASSSVDPVVGTTTSPTRAGEPEISSTRPVPVIVRGDAFGLDPVTLERTVANHMQGADWDHARFVPASQVDPRSVQGQDYVVVMLVNASEDVNPAALCPRIQGSSFGAPPPASAPAQRSGNSRDVNLVGALCRDGTEVREVHTGADNVSGPNDPTFRKAIQQATTELTLSGGEANTFHGSDQDR
jgi:hypothetical protein